MVITTGLKTQKLKFGGDALTFSATYSITSKNKWYNLLLGLAEGLGGDATKWETKCFPSGWLSSDTTDSKSNKVSSDTPFDSKFDSLNSDFKAILDVLGDTIDLMCIPRSAVIFILTSVAKVIGDVKFASAVVNKVKKRILKKNFIQLQKSWISRKWDEIKSTANAVYSDTKSVVATTVSAAVLAGQAVATEVTSITNDIKTEATKQVAQVASDYKSAAAKVKAVTKAAAQYAVKAIDSVSSATKTFFENIDIHIQTVFGAVFEFFNGITWVQVQQAFDCFEAAATFASNLKELYDGFKDKYSAIKEAAKAGAEAAAVVIADILMGLICDWKNFKVAINYFMQGAKEKDVNQKYYFNAKAAGTLIYIIGTSQSISASAIAIKDKVSSKGK